MKILTVKDFGAALRSRRKALGYTQTEVAGDTGFSVSFISDLERGKETAELGKALDLMKLLGMDMEIKERG